MKQLAIAALAAMLMAVAAAAQTDLAITLLSGTTTFSSNGGFSSYSGTTNIDCMVNIGPAQRANLSMTVSQFSPSGGPIVSSGADAGLSFNCTGMLSPIFMHNQASFCSTTRASVGTSHTLIRFRARDMYGLDFGCNGDIRWWLADRPSYRTGAYSATATFTLSGL